MKLNYQYKKRAPMKHVNAYYKFNDIACSLHQFFKNLLNIKIIKNEYIRTSAQKPNVHRELPN